jgi:hypothetical protein
MTGANARKILQSGEKNLFPCATPGCVEKNLPKAEKVGNIVSTGTDPEE